VAGKPFLRWKAGIDTLAQGGAWRWALALGFAIALGGGVWAYDVYSPEIGAKWPVWKAEGAPWLRETVLWIEFLASITLTTAILCWFTALFFCAFCALGFGLPRVLDWLARRFAPRQILVQVRRAIGAALEWDRLWGTVFNVMASLAALDTLRLVLKRPLDYWDAGIQTAIATAIELIVFQLLFAQGRLGWPSNKPVERTDPGICEEESSSTPEGQSRTAKDRAH
jgi:hypothetical protein